MSGIVFSARFSLQTLTASTAYDIFSLKAAAGNVCQLLGIDFSQNSAAQDANDAQLQVDIKSGATTQGSGGTSVTPRSNPWETTATVVTARFLDTTVASAGTIITLGSRGFNDRAGWIWIPTPMEADLYKWGTAATATCLTVSMTTSGTTKTFTSGFNGTIWWVENPGVG